MKLATIDIGTHSVLLLIAEKNLKGEVKALVEEATLTRIGEGMASHSVFLPSGMERTLGTLKRYRALCNKHGVEKIVAVGTAAFRKAKNANDFVAEVERTCGFKIEIISGEREAQLTWKAAATDFGSEIIVLDIGGGSTEIILQKRERVLPAAPGSVSPKRGPSDLIAVVTPSLFCTSIPIGSVLLTEKYAHSDPISEKDYQKICQTIDEHLSSFNLCTYAPKHLRTLVATAGTATTIGAIKKKMKTYKHNEIHGSKISLQELQKIIAEFKVKTIDERKKIPGLEPGRADVILAGSLLLQKVAEHFGIQEITISDRGVRWGLVYEAF